MQIIQIQSTCSNEPNESGTNMCKLNENVNYYELEIDAELGYEGEGFFLVLWVIFLL